MSDEFNQLDREEKLKAENEFLKMKLMLEHGADFHVATDSPPEIENDFLKYVMAIESSFANPVYTTVYKKIGSPTHFKPVALVQDDEIEKEYQDLIDYMNSKGVDLSCCSPNISTRELYRFVTEELFEEQMDDIDFPGVVSTFIYDEFYPDHEYDNTRSALNDCIRSIFSNNAVQHMYGFDYDNLQINHRQNLTGEELVKIINGFKDLFIGINLLDSDFESCTFHESQCVVKGKYKVELITRDNKLTIENDWTVEFLHKKDMGYWYICKVQLGGIEI